jgi:SAM-dependent methyltransferase
MRLQTDLAQPIELPFFFTCPEWLEADSVLDVGTGNAYYLRRLARHFPAKHYVGIDADARHVEVAMRESGPQGTESSRPAMTFYVEDALHVRGAYDVALARLLVQHLPSLGDFLDSMRQAIRPGGTVIVIESADEARMFVPQLESMSRFFETLRASRRVEGYDRDSGRLLGDQVRSFGFEPTRSTLLLVPSTIPGHKDLFLQTYLTVLDLVRAAFHLDFDYARLAADLRVWRDDPASYTQLGVWVASYRRS